MQNNKNPKIKITAGGPYIVSGSVPLSEKNIVPKGKCYEYQEGHALPQAETYALCRCGHSSNAPFCDGSHEKEGFIGEENRIKGIVSNPRGTFGRPRHRSI